MTTEFIILLVIVIAGFAGVLWSLSRQAQKPKEGELLMLQNQLNELSRTMDSKLSESTRAMQEQAGQSSRIIKEITAELTKVGEGQKQVATFADQLQRLQDILKNPKHRGTFGEYSLEMLLQSAFSPNQYQMQYGFSDGTKVDAAIFMGDQIIPIDSKFSLENYTRILDESDENRLKELETVFRRDLKQRIDETAKYIRPDEGTAEFALMFIPAEGLYYELLVNEVGTHINSRDLLQYASKDKKVHIVSPTTFYAFLQSLWQNVRDREIQESTKEILKNVNRLHTHIQAYEEYMKKHGTHLSTTVNSYNAAYKELAKIEKDVVRISGAERAIEPVLLARPKDPTDID